MLIFCLPDKPVKVFLDSKYSWSSELFFESICSNRIIPKTEVISETVQAMLTAEKNKEEDFYAALWKQDEQVKAAREVAETAEQIKRNEETLGKEKILTSGSDLVGLPVSFFST